jgi:phage head maturation protease
METIVRSLESNGEKYIHGYAAITNEPDFYGTIMTKQVIEQSIPHLRQFPAVRFMHKIPLGQIVFDEEVEGITTHIDNIGLYVLCQVYDGNEKEWRMVRNGKWGFSYGFMPDKEGGTGQVCLDTNQCYTGFVKGIIYEISVVDAPAQEKAKAHTIERNLNRSVSDDDKAYVESCKQLLRTTQDPQIRSVMLGEIQRFLRIPEKPQRKFTMRGFDIYEIHEDGTLSIPEREPAPKPRESSISHEKLLFDSRNQSKVKEVKK